MTNSSKWKPEDYACVLRERYQIKDKVDLYLLCKEIGLQIQEVDATNFEGALVRVPNKPSGIIALKSNIREHTRKRFTIAHEIGHYILPGHGITYSSCKSLYIESKIKEIPEAETDANRFASELLLPSSQIFEIVNKKSISISTIKSISAVYETSLMASALKSIELTKENCALVHSVSGKIKWWVPSKSFSAYVRAGEISLESIASGLISNSKLIENQGSVSASCWVHSKSKTSELWEDSIILPHYKALLTIITITSSLD